MSDNPNIKYFDPQIKVKNKAWKIKIIKKF